VACWARATSTLSWIWSFKLQQQPQGLLLQLALTRIVGQRNALRQRLARALDHALHQQLATLRRLPDAGAKRSFVAVRRGCGHFLSAS
jgi:hypothetical protein